MLSRYRGKTKCGSCHGKRLRTEANFVKVGGASITDLVELSLKDLIAFFKTLKLDAKELEIAKRLLKEINNRLDFYPMLVWII